jgi:hypothetical protein
MSNKRSEERMVKAMDYLFEKGPIRPLSDAKNMPQKNSQI